jgi:hypothetical protein
MFLHSGSLCREVDDFSSLLCLSCISPRSSRTMRILPLRADVCICEGGIASRSLRVIPRVAALRAAFSSGDGERRLCARSCVSVDIQPILPREAARVRRCNRSFLALLESRRLNLAAHAALGSVCVRDSVSQAAAMRMRSH